MRKHIVSAPFEVRWGECDPAGIVYHPAYIDWFSVARMHVLSEYGIRYMRDFHDQGIVVVVLGVQCQYRKSLRAEDNITVEAWLRHLSRTRMGFGYRVLNEQGEVCAEGETEHAFVDVHNRPVNVAKRRPELWDVLSRLPVSEEA
ncbi:MAG: acyl-CoA thioesterase [Alicyclobacillus sp.]|nr:acyl-CoA thioesterase [Alicyclobacillus sp.]